MTLTDILEELQRKTDDTICDLGMSYERQQELLKTYIAQAKKKIEEMFGEWVGEDETEGDDYLITGYNQAKQEIRNRVKESK